MKRSGRKQEWSLTLFVFATVLFFPPVVSLFDKPVLVGGMPLAYLVMFGLWALLIGGIWVGARRSPLRGELSVSDGEGPRQSTFDQAEMRAGQDLMGRD